MDEVTSGFGHVCESVHENASITDSPITITDNRIMNPDQRIINPITINLHVHVNELPEGKIQNFISKIIGRMYHAINKPRNETIENFEGLSVADIQGIIVRGCED